MRPNVIVNIALLSVLVMAGSSNTAFTAQGCLDILSDPEGVDIYINGRHEGKTPITCLGTPVGKVTIEAKKAGYLKATRIVVVKLKGLTKIKILMKPIKAPAARGEGESLTEQVTGSLVIFNLLGQVDVYIDGEKKGRGSLSILEIAPGMHDLKVGDFSKEIVISKDKKLKIKADKDGITVLSTPDEAGPGKTASNEAAKPIAERDGRFIRYVDGIVKDSKTGLEWVVGPEKNMTWLQARDWVQSLNIDRGRWRLPTVEELKGLYQKGKGKRNMTPLLKTTGWRIWSEKTNDPPLEWYFDFYFGPKMFDLRISTSPRAFAVRSP